MNLSPLFIMMNIPLPLLPRDWFTKASVNIIREMWDRCSGVPGGKFVFSKLVGRMAAYTGSIDATVEELRNGYCRTTMKDRPRLRNHIRSIHAIALANLAELTGNMAVAYTQPDNARFIVATISVDYVKKGRGVITGECECPPISSTEKQQYQIPVTLRDALGDVVVRATLRTLVGPKVNKGQGESGP